MDYKRIQGFGGKSKYNFSVPDGIYGFPALINIHDHLRGDYLPKVGPQGKNYYVNWSYWDYDLKSSPVFTERANIAVEDCYSLGAYKNLFSGVTTVNDHFPHEFNEPFIPFLPIRVISEYTLAHECSSFDLKWGDGIEVEHRRAVKRNHPFITHLEEGFDPESQSGIEILEKLRCLDGYTVMIHCIGFTDDDIDKVSKAGAHIAWCPCSNEFMFNTTCKIRKILAKGINVSIGTDSTATGSVNLLEEVRYARNTYREMYEEDLNAETLFRMVTSNPARAFRMDRDIGSLEVGKFADILFLRPRMENPYEALVNAEMEDIELLILEGNPIYGSIRYEELFNLRKTEYSRIRVAGREMLVRGKPQKLLDRVREAVGFKKTLEFLPLEDSK